MALFGVYRGTVVNNNDPQVSGRVQVDVEGRTGWALVTITSPKLQVGASVIVAFEHGDANYPVVLGQVT
ncbi:MAG TPA: phage baseplate assembly protein V [Candidatus Sulfotelmatobacter sp.]|nr:phage baseplate assembly protein V [Candidatus Sulfotelmatobacter sp.]